MASGNLASPPKIQQPKKMYGNIKTYKQNNFVRVIKSDCNTALENLPIFVKKFLFEVGSHLPSQIKYTWNMLKIIDDII